MKKLKTVFFILLVSAMLAAVIPLVSACETKDDPDEDLIPTEEVVYYSEYGAVGDGKTDDFEAIQKAHADANEKGIAVAADSGKTYYIGGTVDDIHKKSVSIKTNTYWQDAEFIIDDRGLTEKTVYTKPLFTVDRDIAVKNIPVPEGYSLSVGDKNVNMTFDDTVLMHIQNKEKTDFIRSGPDQNKGQPRQEIILVDKNGNIDPTTPLTWDYEKVTSVKAYSTTDKPITISGGRFTTIANEKYTTYFWRNIQIYRPNTTVRKVTHLMEYKGGNDLKRTPYAGFLSVENSYNVTIEDCLVTGNRISSSYELTARMSNEVTWRNVRQTNGFEGNGIHGSNYCRNLAMENCALNRFDAHMGVYNATLKDCEFSAGICVTGYGTLLCDGVKKSMTSDEYVGENNFLGLRTDYGAFWRGEIVLQNCIFETPAAVNYIISTYWRQEWDYGYTCVMPNVTIENMTINYTGIKPKKGYPYYFVFSNFEGTRKVYLNDIKEGETRPDGWKLLKDCDNPLVMPEWVHVSNCTVAGGKTLILSHNRTGLCLNTQYTVDGKDGKIIW